MFSPHGRLLSPQVFRRGITVSLSTKRWHRPRSNRRPMDGPESKLYHAEALAQTALVGALHAAGFELLVSARVKDRTNRELNQRGKSELILAWMPLQGASSRSAVLGRSSVSWLASNLMRTRTAGHNSSLNIAHRSTMGGACSSLPT
ncbi:MULTISPECIES: hypothetical protein [Bradyrhizobium]|nr:hypothetical protein [Bradyrhizobium barranii]WFT94293.1 hypothetical protein QA633_39425 [Bradyrhizobium barranii]